MRMSAMSVMVISESTVKKIVFATSLIGIVVLCAISVFTGIDTVKLDELEDHSGEKVWTRGSVIGTRSEDDGSMEVLLNDGNITVEIFIESYDEELKTGDKLKLKGEVFSYGETVSMTVQNENGIELENEVELRSYDRSLPNGTFVFFNGTITSTVTTGWSSFDLEIRSGEGMDTRIIHMSIEEPGYDVKIGDTIRVEGMKEGSNSVISYGDRAAILLYRPESRAASLLQLIRDVEDSPFNMPTGLLDIEGYVKYEPTSRTLYLSDEPEGSSISIKVELPEPDPMIHKGDLVRIVNSTIDWDEKGLRFMISSEYCQVLEPYGPWYLILDSLPYGISQFENAMVVLKGEVGSADGIFRLVDGGSSIELRSIDPIPMGGEREFCGRVSYDPGRSVHFLEILEEL